MMIEKKINVAIIGFGLAGEIFHAPFITKSLNFDLVAIVSSQREKILAQFTNVRVFDSTQDMLRNAEVELVVIASPNHTHYELAKLCLQYNKHVVIDKPWVLNTAHAQELIALARQKNRVLCAYQNRRWDGPVLTLRELLQQGVFGEIHQCEFHFDRYRPTVQKTRWKEADISGSVLYDLGPHLFDHALTLFGWPDSLQADLAMQRRATEIIDYFHIVLGYGAMRVILHSGSVILGETPHIQVYGEKASYICYSMDEQENNLRRQKNYPLSNPIVIDKSTPDPDRLCVIEEGNIRQTPLIPMVDNYQQYYDQLYTALITHTPPPVSYDDMLNNVRLIDLAFESYHSGRKLDLTDVK